MVKWIEKQELNKNIPRKGTGKEMEQIQFLPPSRFVQYPTICTLPRYLYLRFGFCGLWGAGLVDLPDRLSYFQVG